MIYVSVLVNIKEKILYIYIYIYIYILLYRERNFFKENYLIKSSTYEGYRQKKSSNIEDI